MYLYFNSEQSQSFFSNNSYSSFRIKLPKSLPNPSPGCVWTLALLDIQLPRFNKGYTTQFITVNSDITEQQILGQTLQPVLQRIYKTDLNKIKPVVFDDHRYITVTQSCITSMMIYLLDAQGQSPSFKPGILCGSCHFEQRKLTQL
jgi:hypothetical protein